MCLRSGTYLHVMMSRLPWGIPDFHEAVFPGSRFLRYYFPDYMWGYSLTFGVYAIFLPSKRLCLYPACITSVVGGLWELLQYTHTVTGTGDWMDVLLYIAAGMNAVMINYAEMRKYV